MWPRLVSWLTAALRRDRLERDLADELEFHLSARADHWRQQGLSAVEAARRARLEFGGVEAVKESWREARGLRWLDELRGDLRYAVRQMSAAPALTAIAVSIFALAIGANTALFSVLETALWRTLPVERPQELRELAWTAPKDGFSGWYNGSMRPYADGGLVATSFAYPVYAHLRNRSSAFSDIFLFDRHEPIHLGIRGHASIASGLLVSGNFFRALGVDTIVGRPLMPQDDRSGAPGVAVLSFACWQRLFGGDRHVIGQTVTVNGTPALVVGVAPPTFFGLERGRPIDVVAPITTMVAAFYDVPDMLGSSRHWSFRVMGRVKPGIGDPQAQAEAEALVREAIAEQRYTLTGVLLNDASIGLDTLRHNYRRPLLLLMSIAAAVLLIACANVAGLLLTRVMARQREMAIRLAIGAGRGRLVRQLLTESGVLAAAGGTLGFALALMARGALLPLLNQDAEPLEVELGVSASLVLFSFGVCLGVGVACGLLPALRATRGAVHPVGAAVVASGDPRVPRSLAGTTLTAAQVALSLVLLVCSGLFARTLLNLRAEALGFRPEQVLLLQIDGTIAGYKNGRLLDLYERALDRIMAVPGVASASLSRHGLLEGGATTDAVVVPELPAGTNTLRVHVHFVAPRYLETMGIPLVLGREFTARDRDGAPKVALVNQTLARRLAQSGGLLGRRILFGRATPAPETEIVGVTGDARFATLRDPAPPTLYLPYRQHPQHRVSLAVRTAGDPAALAATIRQALRELEPNVPLAGVLTQVEQIDRSVGQERTFAQLVSAVAALAVLLASLGIYGTLAYSVARRTTEIGVRMALGAQRRDVIGLVLRESLAPVAAGIVAGVAGSIAATGFVETMLFRLTPNDPPTLLLACAALLASALLAAWLPSRRAARVDPLTALRCE